MAITVNPIVMAEIPVEGDEWCVSLYSADLTGGETIKAAAAGKCHYLTRLEIRCDASSVISIGDRVADTGALTTTILGPIAFTLASTLESQIDFISRPGIGKAVKFQNGFGIGIIAVGVAATSIWAQGKTGPG